MQTTVSHIVELDEPIHDRVAQFLDDHPEWDVHRFFNTAVSEFLLYHQEGSKSLAKVYVANMFSLAKAPKK